MTGMIGVGMFRARRPTTIWAGVEDADGGLMALHGEVLPALAAADIEVSPATFRPHITLARPKDASAMMPMAHRTPSHPIFDPPNDGPVAANPKTNFLSINQRDLHRGLGQVARRHDPVPPPRPLTCQDPRRLQLFQSIAHRRRIHPKLAHQPLDPRHRADERAPQDLPAEVVRQLHARGSGKKWFHYNRN